MYHCRYNLNLDKTKLGLFRCNFPSVRYYRADSHDTAANFTAVYLGVAIAICRDAKRLRVAKCPALGVGL